MDPRTNQPCLAGDFGYLNDFQQSAGDIDFTPLLESWSDRAGSSSQESYVSNTPFTSQTTWSDYDYFPSPPLTDDHDGGLGLMLPSPDSASYPAATFQDIIGIPAFAETLPAQDELLRFTPSLVCPLGSYTEISLETKTPNYLEIIGNPASSDFDIPAQKRSTRKRDRAKEKANGPKINIPEQKFKNAFNSLQSALSQCSSSGGVESCEICRLVASGKGTKLALRKSLHLFLRSVHSQEVRGSDCLRRMRDAQRKPVERALKDHLQIL